MRHLETAVSECTIIKMSENKIMCSEPEALLASLARDASWDLLTPASVLNTQQAHLALRTPVNNVNERCLEHWLRFKTSV